MCSGMMKSRSRSFLSTSRATVSSASGPSLLFEFLDKYVEKLRRPVFNCGLNVVPESLAAEKLREIAPHRVTLPRQLKGEPTRDKIVLGIGVAEKQHVPAWLKTVSRALMATAPHRNNTSS